MNRRDIIGNTKIKNIPGKIRKKIGPSVKKGIKTVKSFVRGAKSGVKNMTVADAIMNTVAPGSTIIREGVRQVLKKPDKIKVNRPPGKPPKSTTISGPFKLRSGNKPSIAKLAGIKDNKKRKDIFLTPEIPGKEVKDNMPEMGIKEFKKFIEKNKKPSKINDKFFVNPDFLNKKVIGSHTITKDIKKRK